MDPEPHLIISIIIASILLPVFGYFSLLAIVGGFLIDVDHYIWYVLKKKDISLKRCIDYHYSEVANLRVMHFNHTIEAGIVLAVLSIYINELIPLFIGFIAHMLADLYHTIKSGCWEDRVNSILVWGYKKLAMDNN